MGFQQGLSGLNASSRSLDVIGNNIANANTSGFKSGRAEFGDVFASSIGASGAGTIGIGVEVSTVSQQFTQGNIAITNNDLDVAINGSGFFTLELQDGSRAYSRAGEFKLDPQGYVITNTGAQVMGFPTDTDGNRNSVTLEPMRMPTSQGIAAQQTTSIIASKFTLDSAATVWNQTTPPTSLARFGTAIDCYDSQGNVVPVELYFRKIAPNVWQVYTDPTSNTTANTSQLAVLEFNTNGTLANSYIGATPPATGPTGSVRVNNWGTRDDGTGNAAAAFTLPDGTPIAAGAALPAVPVVYAGINLTDNTVNTNLTGVNYDISAALDANGAVAGGGAVATGVLPQISVTLPPSPNVTTIGLNGTGLISLDLGGIAQNNSRFTAGDLDQDGYEPGEMVGLKIEANGIITARFSNGETQAYGQLALANFRNVQGLSPTGNGEWIETQSSGQPIYGGPTEGSLGELRSGALEESNVDLTKELVNMMTAQRTYQANAQTIKTQDQVMQTLVNMR
ncbi:flagellar hook protein FlgE [Hylemonella gracilis str. Niagara R]|uniref:Flagellar hook protein FlgE n=1 Tax=Hylemonella gracilis str. Niagara R TaxID=1458275 RepID=A0A016XFK8_9BURK|nr:flagellar hook protein FlgE [Hylemonella gracilis]EYC49988.1 flagellar hook protein FlgE [Hylemonella gracilis str. Niagara R]